LHLFLLHRRLEIHQQDYIWGQVRRLAIVGVALALAAAGTAQAAATPAQVARAWSKALNANHNVAAANLFAHNARVVQPGVDVRLSTRAVAIAFNDAMP